MTYGVDRTVQVRSDGAARCSACEDLRTSSSVTDAKVAASELDKLRERVATLEERMREAMRLIRELDDRTVGQIRMR
jgi:hypothetical protein